MEHTLATSEAHCPLCARPQALQGGEISYSKSSEKKIRHCAGCGLGFVVPQFTKKELEDFYAAGVYWGSDAVQRGRNTWALREAQAEERMTFVKRFADVSDFKAVLDVGAGEGSLLTYLAREKMTRNLTRYCAVEADSRMFEYLKGVASSFGVAAKLGMVASLEELDEEASEDQTFDLIFLSHILEHVTDPLALFEQLKKKAAPGAGLFIELPFRDYRFRKDLGNTGHVTFWGPEQLRSVVEKAGLELKGVEIFGGPIALTPANPLVPKRVVRWEGVLNLSKRFLPSKLARALFRDLYGLRYVGDDGIWLRAYAVFPSKS